MSPRYDASGDVYTAEDVLDAEELTEYRKSEPARSYSRRPLCVGSALDAEGRDSEGFEWGVR